MSADVTHADAKEFYEDFSLAVGQRDWLTPNLRHEQLKLLIGDLIAGRSGLRIADVGCGAGVMTSYLTRFGDVTGVDFSSAAIKAARDFAPEVTFKTGSLEQLEGGYDLITLFDVLEHIPEGQRPGFITELGAHLRHDGLLFCSTPHPAKIKRKREAGDPGLQIIDEQVELADVAREASDAGLQLLGYQAYDVWAGSPEYQAFVFAVTRSFGGAAELRPVKLARRNRIVRRREYVYARRVANALRVARRGRLRAALWFLRAKPPTVGSS